MRAGVSHVPGGDPPQPRARALLALPIVLLGVALWAPSSYAANECFGVPSTIVGDNRGDDIVVGTGGDDVINTYGGNDFVDGRGGSDLICSGDGNDTIVGGTGNDRILGGKGDDQLVGDFVDTAIAGDGDDFIRGRQRKRLHRRRRVV
ncbi:MAG TPA: hypothetical protein VE401_02220 [Solirubrobacterales bacterium]|nr:hypothetical protein [Solirubrobacterales bacterium]